jgi:hypothetical protein
LEWKIVKHKNRRGMWGRIQRNGKTQEFRRSGVWNAGIK